MKILSIGSVLVLASSPFAYSAATVVQRGVQFTEVDFVNSTLTLTNLNASDTVSLGGWRFCTHDDDEVRRYSSSLGLNGVSLLPMGQLVIEFGAVSGNAGTLAIGAIGGNFASLFDRGPYSISLYAETPFGTGANIADHIQWSIDGVDNISADERSDEAQAGGVWDNQSQWVSTSAETDLLVLQSPSAGTVQHGAASYAAVVIPEPSALALLAFGLGSLLRRRR